MSININEVKVQFDESEEPQVIKLPMGSSVSYEEQTLTDAQKEQARENIRAGTVNGYVDDDTAVITDLPSLHDLDIAWYQTIQQQIASKAGIPETVEEEAPSEIELSDNTEYYLTDVSELAFTYPDTRFESWIELTTSLSGDITITLPTSKYIGTAPEFGNGETWEMSIKNGVVVVQKVGDGT